MLDNYLLIEEEISRLRSLPYQIYLKTKHWLETTNAAKARVGYKCERCGNKRDQLNTHHKTYERRGCELPEDLEVLCIHCHRKEHNLPPILSLPKNVYKKDHGWKSCFVPGIIFELMRDRKIAATEFLILVTIKQKSQNGEFCWSNKKLGKWIKTNHTYISSRLKNLKNLGLISIAYEEEKRTITLTDKSEMGGN